MTTWETYLNENNNQAPPVEPLWSRESCRSRLSKVLAGAQNNFPQIPLEYHPPSRKWQWTFWIAAIDSLSNHVNEDRAVATIDVLVEEWESLLNNEFKKIKPMVLRFAEAKQGPPVETLELSF